MRTATLPKRGKFIRGVCVCVCVSEKEKYPKKTTGTPNTGMFCGLADEIAASTTAVLHTYNVIMLTLYQRKVSMEVKHTKWIRKTTVLHLFTQKPVIIWNLFGKVGKKKKKTHAKHTHRKQIGLAAIKLHLSLH